MSIKKGFLLVLLIALSSMTNANTRRLEVKYFLMKEGARSQWLETGYVFNSGDRSIAYRRGAFRKTGQIALSSLEYFSTFLRPWPETVNTNFRDRYPTCFFLKTIREPSLTICVTEDNYIEMYQALIDSASRYANRMSRDDLRTHKKIIRFMRTFPLTTGALYRPPEVHFSTDEMNEFLPNDVFRGSMILRGERYSNYIYKRKERIGLGGFAAVFSYDVYSQNEYFDEDYNVIGGTIAKALCAIKLNGVREDDKIAKPQALLHEALVMNLLGGHENIIEFIDLGVTSNKLADKIYLVMGVGDKNLKEFDVDNLTSKQIYSFALQILNGIRHMHRNNIYHLDIKPENILVKSGPKKKKVKDRKTGQFRNVLIPNPTLKIKVIDFGTAKARLIQSRTKYYGAEFTGTKGYVRSEEFLEHNRGDIAENLEKLDAYATGVTLLMGLIAPKCDKVNEWNTLKGSNGVVGIDYSTWTKAIALSLLDLDDDLFFLVELATSMMDDNKDERISVSSAYTKLNIHIQRVFQAPNLPRRNKSSGRTPPPLPPRKSRQN